MKVGERMKEQRLKMGWSQEQLANELHVSRSAVSSWEVGRNYPDLETILAISDLFGISLDNLLREDMDMVKETAKKTKRTSLYRSALFVIALVCLLFIGYRGKQLFDEYTLRKRFVENGWTAALVEGEHSNIYEMEENDITYKGVLNGGDDQRIHLFVIVNEQIIFEITPNNEIYASFTPSSENHLSSSDSIELNDQVNPTSLPEDVKDREEDQFIPYLEDKKVSFQSLIDKALKLKNEIES